MKTQHASKKVQQYITGAKPGFRNGLHYQVRHFHDLGVGVDVDARDNWICVSHLKVTTIEYSARFHADVWRIEKREQVDVRSPEIGFYQFEVRRLEVQPFYTEDELVHAMREIAPLSKWRIGRGRLAYVPGITYHSDGHETYSESSK